MKLSKKQLISIIKSEINESRFLNYRDSPVLRATGFVDPPIDPKKAAEQYGTRPSDIEKLKTASRFGDKVIDPSRLSNNKFPLFAPFRIDGAKQKAIESSALYQNHGRYWDDFDLVIKDRQGRFDRFETENITVNFSMQVTPKIVEEVLINNSKYLQFLTNNFSHSVHSVYCSSMMLWTIIAGYVLNDMQPREKDVRFLHAAYKTSGEELLRFWTGTAYRGITTSKDWLVNFMSKQFNQQLPTKHLGNLYRRLRGEIEITASEPAYYTQMEGTRAESWSKKYDISKRYASSARAVIGQVSADSPATNAVFVTDCNEIGNRHKFIDLDPLYETTDLEIEKELREVPRFGVVDGEKIPIKQVIIPYRGLEKTFGRAGQELKDIVSADPAKFREMYNNATEDQRVFMDALMAGTLKPLQFENKEKLYNKLISEGKVQNLITYHYEDDWIIE